MSLTVTSWPLYGLVTAFFRRVRGFVLETEKRAREAVKREIRDMPFLAVDISPKNKKPGQIGQA